MAIIIRTTLCLALFVTTLAQPYTYVQYPSDSYSTLVSLPGNEAQLAWNFEKTSNLLSGLYIYQPEMNGGWVAWGINHNDTTDMEVSSVLVCFAGSSGSAIVKVYLLNDTSAAGVNLGGLLKIASTSCVIDGSTSPQTMYMRFSIFLKSPQFYAIYGAGPSVDLSSYTLGQHKLTGNVGSFFDATNISEIENQAGESPVTIWHVHGALNTVGWGIFLPIGMMIARYMKPFADPLWFYTHIVCQLSGYILGCVGFGYGIYLTSGQYVHRQMAFAMLIICSCQVLSVFVKPGKTSKCRLIWKLFHWTAGVTVIAVSIPNILYGFWLLQDYGNWRSAYLTVLMVFGFVCLGMEILTWAIWFKKLGEVKGNDIGLMRSVSKLEKNTLRGVGAEDSQLYTLSLQKPTNAAKTFGKKGEYRRVAV